MVIKLGSLIRKGREILEQLHIGGFFDKDKVTRSAQYNNTGETFNMEKTGSQLKGQEGLEELLEGLPNYAYQVDKHFKDETGDGRNPEMMRKINDAVLAMRKDGVLKTEEKEGGVYTTLNLGGKPIHFLEPDLAKYSDDAYKHGWDYDFGGAKIYKNQVMLKRMRGNVDEWKNKKLKQYVKEKQKKGLQLPKKNTVKTFMDNLAKYVNKTYSCDITEEKNKMDLLFRSMNSVGIYWLDDYQNGSRSHVEYDAYRGFGSTDYYASASLFLTDCSF